METLSNIILSLLGFIFAAAMYILYLRSELKDALHARDVNQQNRNHENVKLRKKLSRLEEIVLEEDD